MSALRPLLANERCILFFVTGYKITDSINIWILFNGNFQQYHCHLGDAVLKIFILGGVSSDTRSEI